jgi:hypothetical protein
MTATFFKSPLNLPRLLLLAVLSLFIALAVQPAAAQFGSDGTTLNDFVLDKDGYAWWKQKPYGAKSLKPEPQLRFMADPGNERGGNALHPESHKFIVELIEDAIKATGSRAAWEIAWTTAPGFAGGYQLKVRSDRGDKDVSCAELALARMKHGKQATLARLIVDLQSIL